MTDRELGFFYWGHSRAQCHLPDNKPTVRTEGVARQSSHGSQGDCSLFRTKDTRGKVQSVKISEFQENCGGVLCEVWVGGDARTLRN